MSQQNSNSPIKGGFQIRKNPYESYNGSSSSNFFQNTAKNTVSSLNKTFGTGLLDHFFGRAEQNQNNQDRRPFEKKSPLPQRKEFTIFRRESHFETHEKPREIEMLKKQIVQEVKLIRQANQSLMAEVKDIDKLTVDPGSEREGIYHLRFLEILINILQTLRKKINESRTWLSVANGRKAKRGGAFVARSKSQGTSYSQSQELTLTRSVQ